MYVVSFTYMSCHFPVYLKFEICLKFLECIILFYSLGPLHMLFFLLEIQPNSVFNDYPLMTTFSDNLI